LRAYNAANCDCDRGLQRSPRPLAGFKGTASRRGGEGKRAEASGGEGKRRRGAGWEGEVDSDAQLEQDRRLAKAGRGLHQNLPFTSRTKNKVDDDDDHENDDDNNDWDDDSEYIDFFSQTSTICSFGFCLRGHVCSITSNGFTPMPQRCI